MVIAGVDRARITKRLKPGELGNVRGYVMAILKFSDLMI